MRSFSFNGVSLRSLGGRITEAPFHTVASRDVEQVKIYGQSGDEVIDNQSYNNVPFTVKIAFLPYKTVKIAFLPYKTAQTANDIARAVIDWLAPLQGAYYTYTDSWNPGYFTKARLTNFDEVKRELRTLLTATLKFSRVPFWYSNSGAVAITTTNGRLTLTNPEAYAAEPVIKITYTGTATNNYRFYLWINNVLLGGIVVGGITPEQYLDAGEAVLTASEAEEYRKAKRESGTGSPFRTDRDEANTKTISQTFSFNITVERLDSDTDIEELAEQVSERIASAVRQTEGVYA